MIIRWLTYIRLFDFDVHHIPGKKNSAADALSRRGKAPEHSDSEKNVDNFFNSKLYNISADSGTDRVARVWLLEGEYAESDLAIGEYLESLRRPDGIGDMEFKALKKKAAGFLIQDGYLFKKSRRSGAPPRRVVSTAEQRHEIMRELHDKTGHRGRNATFQHINRRYQ
jgi:hypothetical protein